MRITYDKKVLSKNDEIAAKVRHALARRGIVALNLIGSPGSGKTSLVEKTAAWCRENGVAAAALTGDQATENDARRIRKAGMPALQITTGNECHLNARRIWNVLGADELFGIRLLLIENVGNLICPASYDLGEKAKIAVLSVPEGDDKPLKYPGLFKRAELVIINKVDMAKLTDFSIERAARNAAEVAPHIEVLPLSCRTGEGLDGWLQWVETKLDASRRSVAHSA